MFPRFVLVFVTPTPRFWGLLLRRELWFRPIFYSKNRPVSVAVGASSELEGAHFTQSTENGADHSEIGRFGTGVFLEISEMGFGLIWVGSHRAGGCGMCASRGGTESYSLFFLFFLFFPAVRFPPFPPPAPGERKSGRSGIYRFWSIGARMRDVRMSKGWMAMAKARTAGKSKSKSTPGRCPSGAVGAEPPTATTRNPPYPTVPYRRQRTTEFPICSGAVPLSPPPTADFPGGCDSVSGWLTQSTCSI